MDIIELTNGLAIHASVNELVTASGKRIRMEGQLMEILLLLLEQKGELVSKETFIERIWKGNQLSGEAALPKGIFKLRELLKTNEIAEIQIETVSRRGYRLLATETAPTPAHTKSMSILFPLGAGLIIVFLSVYAVRFLFFRQPDSFPQAPVRYIDPSDYMADTVIRLGDDDLQVIELPKDTLANDTLIRIP